jgi:uncharacterized metal-binding protein YceD (DUF177 family)
LWLNEILGELVDELGGVLSSSTECLIKLKLEGSKIQHHTYRDAVLLKGDLEVKYPASSSTVGDQVQQELSIPIKTIFIDISFESNEELKEEITLFVEDQEWDLYFHSNGIVDLKSVIHEYIFLNRNPYPGSD